MAVSNGPAISRARRSLRRRLSSAASAGSVVAPEDSATGRSVVVASTLSTTATLGLLASLGLIDFGSAFCSGDGGAVCVFAFGAAQVGGEAGQQRQQLCPFGFIHIRHG